MLCLFFVSVITIRDILLVLILCFSICGIAPILSKYLLPRLNPYALLGEFAAVVVVIEVFLVDQR